MKTARLFLTIPLMVILFNSCNNSGGDKSKWDYDYMAVQIEKDDNWSIIDKDGKVVVKDEYPSDAKISRVTDGAYWVKQNEVYQLFSIDSPKKPLVDDEFSAVTAFASGVSAVSLPDEPIRIIDTKGKTVAKLPTDIITCFAFNDDGYATVIDADHKQGIIDTKGKFILEPADRVFMIGGNEGVLLASQSTDDDQITILDLKGQKIGEINTEKYQLMSPVSEGKMSVRLIDDDESPLVVLDKTGKKLFDLRKSMASKTGGRWYIDGYIVFCSIDDKYGVADDKGETVIRPKYEYITNLGHGLFGSKKKGQMGIVNAEDEEVVDFDYEDVICSMGHNFLVYDSDEYYLINREGKEIGSYSDVCAYGCDSYVQYVKISDLVDAAADALLKLATPQTVSEAAAKFDLNIDQSHYESAINQTTNIRERVKIDSNIYFDGYLSEEKTHTEEVDDGWFVTTKTVSDGWKWTDNVTDRVQGSITLLDVPTKPVTFLDMLIDKLEEASYKEVKEDTYSKSVKLGSKTYESKIFIQMNGNQIDFNINFK